MNEKHQKLSVRVYQNTNKRKKLRKLYIFSNMVLMLFLILTNPFWINNLNSVSKIKINALFIPRIPLLIITVILVIINLFYLYIKLLSHIGSIQNKNCKNHESHESHKNHTKMAYNDTTNIKSTNSANVKQDLTFGIDRAELNFSRPKTVNPKLPIDQKVIASKSSLYQEALKSFYQKELKSFFKKNIEPAFFNQLFILISMIMYAINFSNHIILTSDLFLILVIALIACNLILDDVCGLHNNNMSINDHDKDVTKEETKHEDTDDEICWTRTEAEANKILTKDPKNPIKLWIKHLCLKTDTGTRFYYYMHKINLMYGHLTRFLMLLTLIAIACVKLGFIIVAQPKLLAIIFNSLMFILAFILYLLVLIVIVATVYAIFELVCLGIHYAIKAIINIVAAVLF